MTALTTSPSLFLPVSDGSGRAMRCPDPVMASVTDVADRMLDLWAEALSGVEMLAVTVLQSGRDSAQALQNGLLSPPLPGCPGGPCHVGLDAADLWWSVLEAAILPYRDFAGRVSIRLAPVV